MGEREREREKERERGILTLIVVNPERNRLLREKRRIWVDNIKMHL
jgi:hypothetical protein